MDEMGERAPENAAGQAVERISGGKLKAEVRDAHDGGGDRGNGT